LKAGAVAVAFLAALTSAPEALAERAAAAPPSSTGLLELPNYEYALVQLTSGSLAVEGAQLVSPTLRIWRLPTRAALRVLPGLLSSGRANAVEPDRPLRPAAVQADPLSPTETWRAQIGADRAAPPGPGRPLTLVDTGLEAAHPEFAGRANTSLLNSQRLSDSDVEWHGTAVASLAAAPENGQGIVGVYPQASVRMWDAGPPTVARVIAGLEAAAAAAPGVVNLSLGFFRGDVDVPMLTDAVHSAFRRGVLAVAAAGNDRQAGSPRSVPADLTHVLTVASASPAGTVSAFSNVSAAIDLAAPGEGLLAARQGSWGQVTGTSFATSFVSAAAAWTWTARPQLEKTQLFELLRRSARDLPPAGVDSDTGYGMLDIPAALTRPAPAVDPQEPNDDVRHVRAGAFTRTAAPPLTTPRRGRVSLRARLDASEDPEDVYRVWVPGRRVVRFTAAAGADVDLDVWKPTTPSVFVEGAARRQYLLGASTRRGTLAERVTVRNRGARGYFAYADVYLRENGPDTAEYRLTISTARR
jgi:subtilisin family serine protease